MYSRHIEPELYSALADTPVVLLNGARQTGKSTLAREVAKAARVPYATLDDATQRAAADSDPRGFLDGLGERAVIDEVQKTPWDISGAQDVGGSRPPPGSLSVDRFGECAVAAEDFRVTDRSYGVDNPLAAFPG